ncbi:MAG: DUF1003 domain-containing protein [Betaproteobacteria bacterium]|nr:DUF1003 domain-containing protein [Betaproteobacteria bacterium]NBY06189.1 DUF1003 domain-containing protein [Betaproteobacteria bacterium]
MTDPSANPNVHFTHAEQHLLNDLRKHRQSHRQNRHPVTSQGPDSPPPLTWGQKVADQVADTVGSWRFIIIQSALILAWITWNTQTHAPWDPYPFILLNLMLSFQAAYTAPAIMMSQNRLAQTDRKRADNDYEVNVKAELEIELLHEKVDLLREQELKILADSVQRLSKQIDVLLSQAPDSGSLAPR